MKIIELTPEETEELSRLALEAEQARARKQLAFATVQRRVLGTVNAALKGGEVRYDNVSFSDDFKYASPRFS